MLTIYQYSDVYIVLQWYSDSDCVHVVLSPQLLHSPSDFSEAADRLCTKVKRDRDRLENGDHLCFLGSGREQEDQYVTMVVAKFLQKSTPYVSLARGGFLGEWWEGLGGGGGGGGGWRHGGDKVRLHIFGN